MPCSFSSLAQSFKATWLRFAGPLVDELQAAQVTSILGDPDGAAAVVRPREVGVVHEEGRDALLAALSASDVERAATIVFTNVRVSSVSEKKLDCGGNVAFVGQRR